MPCGVRKPSARRGVIAAQVPLALGTFIPYPRTSGPQAFFL
jgi:hypothetical protein